MFLALSVAIVPAGPETELNRASVPPWAGQPARWHPTRAAGRRGPTLPVPTESVQKGGGRGGGSQDKCPSMSPRGRLPSWGRRWEKGEQGWGLAHSYASAPLLPASPLSELELSGGPLWPSCSSLNRPSTSLPHLRLSARTVPSARPVLPTDLSHHSFLASPVPSKPSLSQSSCPRQLQLT